MHCVKYRFAGPRDTVHIGRSSRVVWRGAEKSLSPDPNCRATSFGGVLKSPWPWRRLPSYSKSDHGYSVLMVSYVNMISDGAEKSLAQHTILK